MRCEAVRPMLNAFVDNELDPMNAEAVSSHLQGCAECQAQHGSLLAVSRTVSNQPRFALNESQLQKMAGLLPAEPKPRPSFLWARSFALGAASMAAVWVCVGLLSRPGDARVDGLLQSHIRSLMPGHMLDVISTDRHTVKPWFAGKVSVAPFVLDLKAQGFPLLGGRVDYISSRPTPVLVFGHGSHFMSVFVLPKDTQIPVRSGSKDGFQMTSWVKDDLEYIAVSDTDSTELARFTELYRGSAR